MRSAYGFAALIALVLIIVLISASTFQVQQTQQAIVLRFGEPVAGRGLIVAPGLHFKLPFVEEYVPIDNRILDLEAPKQEVLASDNTRIEVDAFLRYKIVDPLKFYQSVGTIERAKGQLLQVMNSAVRRVLGEANLQEIVRDNRSALMLKIRDEVNQQGGRYGVTAIDVRIRRADLPRQISEKVFSRMQSERAREAAEYRAQGSEQAQKISAKADRDVVVLRGDAQKQADQVRGEGDATRNKIFAEAYGKDPGFFAFYRSMQAYETGLKGSDTRMLLSPKSDFFRYFGTPHPDAPTSDATPSAAR